jgi:chaperonin GroEL
MYKEVKFESNLTKDIVEGVNIVADAVTATLGPRGTNVIYYEDGFSYPTVTKDGVTVAQNILLKDKFKNL